MRRGTRRIVTRLVEVACPPDDLTAVASAVVDDLATHTAALAPVLRRGIGPVLWAFDQLARFRNRGRRFVRLDDTRARAYLEHVLTERSGPVALVVRLVKGLIVLCYYEQPAVTQRMGYDPAAYVAQVSARRLATYGLEPS
jgi:hypothetical protein